MKSKRPRERDIAALLDTAAAHYGAGRVTEARDAYLAVERIDPRDFRAQYSLAVIDLRLGRPEPARRRLQPLARRRPDDPLVWRNLGAALAGAGRWRQACAAYGKALALRPDDLEAGFALAGALAVEGRIEDALAAWRALARTPAARPQALARLAILRPAAVTDAELAAMEADARGARADTAIAIAFALGAVFEARGQHDTAFKWFAAGSSLKLEAFAAAGVDVKAIEREHEASARAVRSRFTAAALAEVRPGDASSAPIFIVGFPRCGSSLAEQILASHPQVQGLGETNAFHVAEGEVLRGGWDRLRDPESARQVTRAYLAALRDGGWRSGSRPVDKTLENFLRVGLIARLFPKAVIIDCRREPVATCVASFCELFAAGGETLCDLAQIGREYVRYRSVMEHWRTVLPGRIYEFDYEALVADPETQIRRLVVEICVLPWDQACLAFHETRRPIATASAVQARRPIHSEAAGRWRAYASHLAPLLESLGPYAPR